MKSVITGIGRYIPTHIKTNADFALHRFFDEDQQLIPLKSDVIAQKFEKITGIQERRYATADLNCFDMAVIAAEDAILDAGCDRESIDQIIVAHNFGDVVKHTIQTDMIPSVASCVKSRLGITNPSCVMYDVIFVVQVGYRALFRRTLSYKSEWQKKCLVIGAEALSRVLDQHDRDSMIFSDGAGATLVELEESSSGILVCSSQSHRERTV